VKEQWVDVLAYKLTLFRIAMIHTMNTAIVSAWDCSYLY